MNEFPEIIQLQETTSTNTALKKILNQRKIEECSVVITTNQTAGRGQMGQTWVSPPGKNITFSMVLYPLMVKASEQFLISKTIALGLVLALEKVVKPITIKWPNDLYYQDQKIGGILIENSLQGSTIIQCVAGIGININQEKFPAEIPNPVSIRNITGKESELTLIFQSIYQSLIDTYNLLVNNETSYIENEYLNHLYRKNGWHIYRDEEAIFAARFSAIGPAGHLILERENGKLSKYAFKEIEYILTNHPI